MSNRRQAAVWGVAVCLVLLLAHPAGLMAQQPRNGLDFLKLPASQLKPVVEPMVHNYVSKGYKEVPSWSRLASHMRNMIRDNGWGDKDIHQIAFRAARDLGMSTQ